MAKMTLIDRIGPFGEYLQDCPYNVRSLSIYRIDRYTNRIRLACHAMGLADGVNILS